MSVRQDNENGQTPENKDFDRKDILAFCIVLYQILLPQLLIIFACFGLVGLLMYFFWLR